MKNLFVLFIFLSLFIQSCKTTSWTKANGDNSMVRNDDRRCESMAYARAPIYICRDPLMCAPDEYSLVLNSSAQNKSIYEQCMYSLGYYPN